MLETHPVWNFQTLVSSQMFKEPPKIIKRERRSISEVEVSNIPQTLLCKTDYDVTPQRENQIAESRPRTPSNFQKDKETTVRTNLLLGDTYTLTSGEDDEEQVDRYDCGLPYPLCLFYPSIATQTSNDPIVGKIMERRKSLETKDRQTGSGETLTESEKTESLLSSSGSSECSKKDSQNSAKTDSEASEKTGSENPSSSENSMQLSSSDILIKGPAAEREMSTTMPEEDDEKSSTLSAITDPQKKQEDTGLRESDFNTLLESEASTTGPELSVYSLEKPGELDKLTEKAQEVSRVSEVFK